MTSIERYYSRYGYARSPTEQLFAYRHRCEWCTGLRTADAKPLRERLYRMWVARMGLERPVLYDSEALEYMMDRVAAQFANVMSG